MNRLGDKIKVVLTALPTLLATISVLAGVVLTQVVPALPDNIGAQVAAVCATVLVWVGVLTQVISRLTPAEPGTYGLLPPEQ
jgi:hypothetical protein